MHNANKDRYLEMKYRRCGKSGIVLPEVSLGLWQNFGKEYPIEHQKEIICEAFDRGITHFDLANNYGFPYIGLAEKNFGTILNEELKIYRDEMIISTKAGYRYYEGPYGDGGSRKYLFASLDRSLLNMQLDYVDIFYHHRPDFDTPIEETCNALSDIVRQGKALYVGLSNYKEEEIKEALKILKENKTPCLISQPRYNMFERWVEDGLLSCLDKEGVGCIAYSPLAQGALTDRYLKGIPKSSRASREGNSLKDRYLDNEKMDAIRKLNEIATDRGESLAVMALSWILRRKEITSVLIGASSVNQLRENLKVLNSKEFTKEELEKIGKIIEKVDITK